MIVGGYDVPEVVDETYVPKVGKYLVYNQSHKWVELIIEGKLIYWSEVEVPNINQWVTYVEKEHPDAFKNLRAPNTIVYGSLDSGNWTSVSEAEARELQLPLKARLTDVNKY